MSDYERSPVMDTSAIAEGGWRAPDLGLQTIGGNGSHVMDYLFVGFLTFFGVPLLLVSAPIWLPLMALGWLVVKVMNRFDRPEPDEPKPLRHNPGDRQW